MKSIDRLYVTDLDGTLLDPQGRLSEPTRRGLLRLLAAGVPFTVASARSVISIREILGEDLPLSLPIIEFNGAYLSEYPSGRHLATESIAPPAVHTIYDYVTGQGLTPFVSCHDGAQDRSFYERVGSAAMQWYIDDRLGVADSRLTHTPSLRGVLDHAVVCMALMDRRERLEPVHRVLTERLDGQVTWHFYQNMYDPAHWWLTAHPGQASKATAIGQLTQHLGVQVGELVVFGDHDNDIAMFRRANSAVAVANATQALKAHATQVIGPNTSHSVVRYILEREGLGELEEQPQ